jgi:hypothetical protein
MAKITGGVRILKTGSKQYNARELEVQQMQNSGLYSSVEFSKTGGGWVAIEQSSMSHKEEELDAAKFLANRGYKVTLKDETGGLTTYDGKIFNYSFEQITPEGSTINNIKHSLDHAKEKRADIALMYMKYNRHTKQSVVEGIKEFEKKHSTHRFKEIIIVTPYGRIHRHKHN